MAIKKCRECGHQISTTAGVCPSCGAKVKRRFGCGSLILVLILIGIIITVISNLHATRQKAILAQQFAQEKQSFESDIEGNYQNLTSLKSRGDTQGAMSIVSQFEKYNRLDYRDTAQIAKELKALSALNEIKTVKSNDYKRLYELNTLLSEYYTGKDTYNSN